MRILPILVAAFIGTVLFTSCSSTTDKTRKQQEAETILRVENLNGDDMTVWVLRGSQRIRLGRVTRLTVRDLRIPDVLLFGSTSLKFSAEPIGFSKRSSTSRQVMVSPGEKILWVIPRSINR